MNGDSYIDRSEDFIEPVIDPEYAKTGKRPQRAAAPPAAPQRQPAAAAPGDTVMARPASKAEGLARVRAMLGGGALGSPNVAEMVPAVPVEPPARSAEPLVTEERQPAAPEAAVIGGIEGTLHEWGPKVTSHTVIEHSGGEIGSPTEKPPKNRPAAPEPSTLDREAARAREASYRDRNREAYNDRKRELMRQRRHKTKLARIKAQRGLK
jgi:hypothetical protein